MNARPPSLPGVLGQISQSLGHSPLLGRLHGLLVMAPEPVSLDELCTRVGAAKSTVSVAIRRLEAAGLVRRVASPGDRRDYWSASASVGEAMALWFAMHISGPLAELRQLEQLSDGLPEARLGEAVEVLTALESVLAKRAPAE